MTEEQHRFGYHFAILHRLIIALNKKEIAELGIHATQIPFMVELFQKRSFVTQDELSSSLVIDKSSTARALGQLEKKGLVQRRINPDNRRQNMVTVTERARKIESRFFGILQRNISILTTNFSEAESREAKRLIDRMIANASQVIR